MPLQRVLVGYDGTEHSDRALQFAVGMNDDYETEIHLAFVVNEPAGMADPIPSFFQNFSCILRKTKLSRQYLQFL